MNYLAPIFLLICLLGIRKSHGSYYWRVYNSKIPSDAYSPGQDSSQRKIYIGQGLLLETLPGLYPTTIHVDKDVYIAMYGPKLTNRYVQILCSTNPENFEWIPTNSTNLHLVKTDNELVPGGLEVNNGRLAIGRIRIQGETVIGKIMSDIVGTSNMWYIHNGKEKKITSYELLTYRKEARPRMGNETYPYVHT